MTVTILLPQVTVKLALRIRDQMAEIGCNDYAIASVRYDPDKMAHVELVSPTRGRLFTAYPKMEAPVEMHRTMTIDVF